MTLRPLRLSDARAVARGAPPQRRLASPVGGDPAAGGRSGGATRSPTFGMMVRRLRREAREAPHPALGADLPGPARRPADRRRHRVGLPARRLHRLLDRPARWPDAGSCPPRWRWRATTASTPCDCTGSRSTSGPRTRRHCAWSRSSACAARGSGPQYLHIDGAWRDHVTFVVYAGEFPDGVARVATCRNSGLIHRRDTPNVPRLASLTIPHGRPNVTSRDGPDLRRDHCPMGRCPHPHLAAAA